MFFFNFNPSSLKNNSFICMQIEIALKTDKILVLQALKNACAASAIASKIVAAQVPTSGYCLRSD